MTQEQEGKFIVLYGANNLGKSKQVDLLRQSLEDTGLTAERIKYPIYDLEPTGPIINSVLRQGVHMEEVGLQQMYAQNRLDFQPTLTSYLDSGKWVVAEDYNGTGVAWGMVRRVPLEVLEAMNVGLLQEDLAIFLHGERFTGGIEADHRNERDEEIWKRSQEHHFLLAQRYGWKKVYATRSIEEVQQEIWSIVSRKFSL